MNFGSSVRKRVRRVLAVCCATFHISGIDVERHSTGSNKKPMRGQKKFQPFSHRIQAHFAKVRQSRKRQPLAGCRQTAVGRKGSLSFGGARDSEKLDLQQPSVSVQYAQPVQTLSGPGDENIKTPLQTRPWTLRTSQQRGPGSEKIGRQSGRNLPARKISRAEAKVNRRVSPSGKTGQIEKTPTKKTWTS